MSNGTVGLEAWPEVSLASLLASMESGSRPRGGVRGIADGVPSLGGEHLSSDGTFKFENLKFVPRAFYESMRRGHIQVGDVLVVKDGATTGKVAFVDEQFPFTQAVANEHLFVCRPAEVEGEYLYWFLRSADGQRRLLEHFKGSAQGGITRDFADATMIPVAPESVRRRVVDLLRTAEARASSIDTALAVANTALSRFRSAVLLGAVSGRLSADWRARNDGTAGRNDLLARLAAERARLVHGGRKHTLRSPYLTDRTPELPETWTWVAADELCSVITKGTTPSASLMTQDEGEIPFLKVYNLTLTGSVDFSVNPTFVSEETHSGFLKRSQVAPGDVLMNIVGPPLGKVARVPDDHKAWNINQAIAVFRPLLAMNPEYLALCLMSPLTIDITTSRAKATAGQYNLTLEICREVAVPLPPPVEQALIVHRVSDLLDLRDQHVKSIVSARSSSEQSVDALQAKVFRGEHLLLEGESAVDSDSGASSAPKPRRAPRDR